MKNYHSRGGAARFRRYFPTLQYESSGPQYCVIITITMKKVEEREETFLVDFSGILKNSALLVASAKMSSKKENRNKREKNKRKGWGEKGEVTRQYHKVLPFH